jgi:hypothetical protein
MATVAVASPWRRYLRISLRELIVIVLVLGSALGWIVQRAKVQRDAVAAIERAGGSVKYEWERKDGWPNPSGNPWWPKLADLRSLSIFYSQVSDNGMEQLRRLPRLDQQRTRNLESDRDTTSSSGATGTKRRIEEGLR